MKPEQYLRVGAIGSMLATLSLVAMLFISWPFDFSFPGEQFLTGNISLSQSDLAQYVKIIRVYFALDSLFILAWIVAWLGFTFLIRPRSNILSNIALMLGLIGAFLDFTENEILWALVQGRQWDVPPQIGWLTVWSVTRQLSYWIAFTAATIIAICLWNQKTLDRIMSLIGTLFVALAALGMYIPNLSAISGIWWLVWFGVGSILLYRRANEWEQQN